jgi:hypothetical protein
MRIDFPKREGDRDQIGARSERVYRTSYTRVRDVGRVKRQIRNVVESAV